MNKPAVLNTLSRTFGKTGLKIKKYSPEVLIAAGIVGTVASAVLACKATLKLNDILEESKKKVDTIHDAIENPTELTAAYTEEDSKKDLALVYAQTGIQIAKIYAPAVILGVVSITGIITSNRILRTRNVALAAAFTAVNKEFKEYRDRVIERFGSELDKELKYNVKVKEVEETVTKEDGTEEVVKKTVNVSDNPFGYSQFARFFDDGCLGWDKDPQYSLMFLTQRQSEANTRLKKQGHLFLNEVYDMLGIPRTTIGQTVGWIYDEKNPNGDNYVDFGIFDTNRAKNGDFVNGYERVIILDFNVDGRIIDLI